MNFELIGDSKTRVRVGDFLQLLRTDQWVKNCFVLAPLFFSASLLRLQAVLHASEAFIAFCLISSAVYIFNDWRDIEADRADAEKRLRPLPSGRVPIPIALAIMVVLTAGAFTVAFAAALPPAFLAILASCCAFLPADTQQQWSCRLGSSL